MKATATQDKMSGTKKYFVYTITCAKTKKVYVGISKSESKYYNPLNYFIEQNKNSGSYTKLAESIKANGKSSHIVTKLTKEGCYNIDLEAAEKVQYKFITFFGERTLNDSNVEPVRYTCKCGYRILEHKKASHYCKLDVEREISLDADNCLVSELDEVVL